MSTSDAHMILTNHEISKKVDLLLYVYSQNTQKDMKAWTEACKQAHLTVGWLGELDHYAEAIQEGSPEYFVIVRNLSYPMILKTFENISSKVQQLPEVIWISSNSHYNLKILDQPLPPKLHIEIPQDPMRILRKYINTQESILVVIDENFLANEDYPFKPRFFAPDIQDTAINHLPLEWQDKIQKMKQLLNGIQNGHYFSMLGLPLNANEKQISKVRSEYEKLFDPLHWDPNLRTHYQKELSIIRETLEDAWHVLCVKRSREKYRNAIIEEILEQL